MLISGDNCGEIDATACQLLNIDEPEHVQLARSARVFAAGYSVKGDEINLTRASDRPLAKELKFWDDCDYGPIPKPALGAVTFSLIFNIICSKGRTC